LRFPVSIGTLGLCCLLLCACADTAVYRQQSYIVRPHDTLYSIAWRHDLDYRDLARWNHIGSDYRIAVGEVLVLGPAGAAPTVPKPPRAAPAGAAKSAPGAPATAPAAPAATPVTNGVPAATYNGTLKCVWPTERAGAPLVVPGGGILLSGRLGQDVRAACAGHVVYTGSGLRGYGNLIIIKHADNLLSAYAHNREVLAHEGQDVAAGEVIAHMGEGGRDTPILYFEIRLNGKPIDALTFFSNMK
jgi:lipoprotein NlpD